jgi:hypothetical protein
MKSSAFGVQKIPLTTQNLATFVLHMAKYKALNWAKVFVSLSKKLRTIPVVYTKYSKQ